eukprot:GILI01024924.1.p1 GENE.GILI01024924.1~~GILI01024924.1.p1  ORF type:complete len:318 (+),score=66.84 GILI01024924.1:76-1029(+)
MSSTSKTPQRATRSDNLVAMLAGGAAGICSTCVVNPLDTLRVRLAASRDATGAAHKSIVGHIKGMFVGGVSAAFSKGLAINLIASTPSNAIYLSSYRMLNYEATHLGINAHAVPILSAGGAVCATNLTLSPLFVLRTRVQIDPSSTFVQYAKQILKKEGVKGFYRGTATNIAGRLVEECTFWYVFETLKRVTDQGKLHRRDEQGASSHAMGGGAYSFFAASAGVLGLSSASKLVGTSISYPYNVVMIHQREVDKATGKHLHTKLRPTIRHIYKCDGVAGFYKGLSPHLLRSVVSKATQIYAFELIMSVYEVSKHKQK